jgi:hypothetical protein
MKSGITNSEISIQSKVRTEIHESRVISWHLNSTHIGSTKPGNWMRCCRSEKAILGRNQRLLIIRRSRLRRAQKSRTETPLGSMTPSVL